MSGTDPAPATGARAVPRFHLGADAAAELERWLKALPPGVHGQDAPPPAAGDLPARDALCARARAEVLDGRGIAVVEGLPLDAVPAEHEPTLAWGLVCGLGQVVSQKVDGTRLYHVRDQGVALAHGVRRSITNLEQELHSDAPWLDPTPRIVVLACLHPASGGGGESRLADLDAAHDALEREDPDLLARLYEPFCWDRQAEHDPDEPPFSRRPVFERRDGRLEGRHYTDYVYKGQELAGEPLDDRGARAIEALRRLLETAQPRVEMSLARGEILLADNRTRLHARTAFDDPDGAASRELLRLWVRDEGGIGLEGD